MARRSGRHRLDARLVYWGKMGVGLALGLAGLVLAASSGHPAAAQAAGYHVIKKIALGGDGGWDYLTMDGAAHRLYVSHGDRVVIVDTQSGEKVGEIGNTPGVPRGRGRVSSRPRVHQQRPREQCHDLRPGHAEGARAAQGGHEPGLHHL